MKKKNLLLRIGLFAVILFLGTGVAMFVGETRGLALADLSDAPVKMLADAPYGNELYAALNQAEAHSVYRSDDYGRSWQKVAPLPNVSISALEIHPTNEDTIFVGTSGSNRQEGSLWYSNNKGASWQRYTLNLPANADGQLPAVSALTVDPNHPGILYVGTQGRGLYRVQSGYAGFEVIGDPSVQDLYVNDVVVAPQSQVYAVTTDGLMVIEDNHLRRIATLPDAAVSLTIDPANPKILYAGTVGYGLHRSTDGGQSWQPMNNGLGWQPGIILRIPAIAIDRENPQHLALAAAFSVGSRLTGDGIYESFNGGRHWTKIADTRELANRITIEAGGIYVAADSGLTRYGNPLPSTTPETWFRTRLLASPTVTQAAILLLTIALGGLVLLGRIEWFLKIRHVKTA